MVKSHLSHRSTDVVLRRRLVPQEFLHRGGNLAEVVLQLLPLVGVMRERDCGVADQLGNGLRAGSAQKSCKSGDFEVVQGLHFAVLALDLGGDQAAQHVIAGLGSALLNEVVVEPDDLRDGLQARLRQLDLTGFPM
jgi:hypothetical protein